MSGPTTPPDDNYFNDLSQNPNHRSASPPEGRGGEADGRRPKRIACIICRKRKLRCDGGKPKCATCSRLGHKCAYDEFRRKSGPKRGYVKELEARLAQVETQLKSKAGHPTAQPQPMPGPTFSLNESNISATMGDQDMMSGFVDATTAPAMSSVPLMPNVTVTSSEVPSGPASEFPWEMIGLGLEEPLPPADLMNDLHQIYFETIHPSLPMIHKYRYLAAMNLAPHMRPSICLRYAMWALAASVTEKYLPYAEVFYQRARKYAEIDEMKSHGEAFITVGHAQCWTLIACFEFKMMYFPRAWMSTGRASRLTQMLGLQRVDGVGLEVKQTLPPPRDWTDREERRRTFWMAYCNDRYASIGTGWPMVIEERDIMTKLPATNEAYEKSRPQETTSLADALTADGAASLSSFAGVILIACLFGRNLTHLHRSGENDRPEDPANGEFWKRHHKLDSILSNTMLFLPEHLRVPFGNKDPNVIFLNVNIHASVICLHQAAILKAEKHDLNSDIIRSSTDRCFAAAEEIINIMKLITHINSANLNPFLAFCLYVAARVFTHAYKKHRGDDKIRANLEFILNTMQAHKKKNNLTESFLIQLVVDLDSAGLENPLTHSRQSIVSNKHFPNTYHHEGPKCAALFLNPSETQPTFHEVHGSGSTRSSSLPNSSTPLDKHGSSPNQYPVSSFTVPTRERRGPVPVLRGNAGPVGPAGPTGPMPGILLSQGLGPVPGNDPHRDPFQPFDAEMSSEDAGDRYGMSGQPTPDSHRGSSNTSYSPPGQSDGSLDGSHAIPDPRGESATGAPYYHHQTDYQPFTTAASYAAHNPTSNDFAMGEGWGLGGEDMENPMADQHWAVLDDMRWPDESAMGDGLEAWRPMQTWPHEVSR